MKTKEAVAVYGLNICEGCKRYSLKHWSSKKCEECDIPNPTNYELGEKTET